jgi:hypothetical protein
MRIALTTPAPSRREIWLDRGMRALIFGGGLVVLGLLVWAHLGLGALIFPPAASPERQTAIAGAIRITLRHDSGQLLVGKDNTLSLVVADEAGQPLHGASAQLDATMVGMPMAAPTVSGAARTDGQMILHPMFAMAGTWRVTATIHVAGQSDQRVTFIESVRWR